MSKNKKCSQCGAELPPDAPGGHCLKCLLELGLSVREAGSSPPTSAGAVSLLEKPGDVIGRYKLLQQLGEGGCGVVYLAEQVEPVRRQVALKVIKLGMDTKRVIIRFEAERQALALMDHPNIAKVLDAGATETGRPYFVMELVRGIKITDYCDQSNLSTRERLDLFIQICRAIQHAHQKGIIHRDIKPSNILVTMNDGVPMPKVIDFGIAKATHGKLTDHTFFTAFEQFIGTPAYMSPEQAEMSALDIDTRSDIYSLGVLLYELLTGKTPFDARELIEAGLDGIRRKIREKEPAKPSTRLSTMLDADLTVIAKHRKVEASKLVNLVSGDLDWIVMKTLEKDRTRRYETASGLATDLQRHLNNEPVTARPPGNLYRFQKMVRRNKLVFAAVGAVAAALIIGLAVSTWMFFQEKAARERAVVAEHEQASLAREAEAQRRMAEKDRSWTRKLAYDSDMLLVSQAIKEQNPGYAHLLLAQHLPEPGQEDLRDWEWRYFSSLCENGALYSFTNGDHDVYALAFSPNGNRLFAGANFESMKTWNLATRKLESVSPDKISDNSALLLLTPKTHRLISIIESPLTHHCMIKLTDPDTEQIIDQFDVGEYVRAITVSDNERYLATLAPDSGLKIWDLTSRQIVKSFSGIKGNDKLHGNMVSSATDPMLIVGDQAGILHWISFDSLEEVRTVRTQLTASRITTLACSADGSILATAGGSTPSSASIIKLWDARTGEELGELDGHAEDVTCLTFSADGTLASGSRDQTIKLWNPRTMRELATLQGSTLGVASLIFSPDGTMLASGSFDCTISIWDAHPRPQIPTATYLPQRVRGIALSQTMKSFAILSVDQTVALWELRGARTMSLRETLPALGTNNSSVAMSADGKFLAAAKEDGQILIWDADRQMVSASLRFFPTSVRQMTFFPHRRLLAVMYHNKGLVLWDTVTWKPSCCFTNYRPSSPIAISVQENKIAMKTDSANVLVWDFTDNQTIGPWKCGGTIRSIAFNADGTRIAIAGFGMLAGVWDIISKTRIGNFNSQLSEAISLSASPNGKRFIIGHAGEGICLCDAETLREVCTLETRQVTSSVDMTADGQFITALNGVTAQIYAAPNFTEFQPGTPAFLNRIEFENARRLRDLGGREYLGYKSHDAEKTLVDALTRFKKLDEVADQASTLLLLGDVYRSLGQLDEAEKNHREALELRRTFLEAQDPGVIDSCQELAITLAMRQKLTEAELLCTNSLHVQNELAWFLATGSESKYRDGARAVKLAGEVVALTGRKLDIYLGTLAVAYAEVGDFTNAVAVQREAIARLENQKLKNDFETRLKMFEDHVPFHQMQHQIE